jgi:hypothetical protein
VDAPVESPGTVRHENPFTGDMVDGDGVPEALHSTSWWSDGPQSGSGEMAAVIPSSPPWPADPLRLHRTFRRDARSGRHVAGADRSGQSASESSSGGASCGPLSDTTSPTTQTAGGRMPSSTTT